MGYSTETALMYLSDHIRGNLDKGLLTGMVIIDLQKAFDTVDHRIVGEKLKAIGADQNVTDWFSSYYFSYSSSYTSFSLLILHMCF